MEPRRRHRPARVADRGEGRGSVRDPGRRSASRRAVAGFTLAELVLVLMIAGFLAVTSVPVLRGYERAVAVRRAANQLQMVLQYARSRAATANRIVGLEFQPSDGFVSVFVDEDADGTRDPGEDVLADLPGGSVHDGLRGHRLPTGLSYGPPDGTSTGPLGLALPSDGVSFTGDVLRFFPEGDASEVGQVAIRDESGRAYAVTVTAGGSIRARVFSGGDWK